MAAAAVQPVLDAVLGLGDGCTHDALGRSAVGIGGRAGSVALVVEAFEELVVGLADVLAQNVAAGGFIPGKVTWGRAAERSIGGAWRRRSRVRRSSGRGLAGREAQQRQGSQQNPYVDDSCHDVELRHGDETQRATSPSKTLALSSKAGRAGKSRLTAVSPLPMPALRAVAWLRLASLYCLACADPGTLRNPETRLRTDQALA